MDKSLEEKLCECVEDLKKKKVLSISCIAAGPASMFFPTVESPNRGNETSPNLHHERGNASRVTNEKMGPRQGAVTKHRQQRHTCKGSIKVYPADASNFKTLVYEHTSQLSSAPSPDFTAQPTSPLTPHSITSTSSTWGFTSQPSSPTTPHSIPSSSTSPLSSPHHGPSSGGLYLNSPFEVHAECGPHVNTHLDVPKLFEVHSHHLNTHLNVPNPHPLQCCVNQNLNPTHNTILHQSSNVPRCALTPCLGISNEGSDVSSKDGQPQGISPAMFARVLSLERYLMNGDGW